MPFSCRNDRSGLQGCFQQTFSKDRPHMVEYSIIRLSLRSKYVVSMPMIHSLTPMKPNAYLRLMDVELFAEMG